MTHFGSTRTTAVAASALTLALASTSAFAQGLEVGQKCTLGKELRVLAKKDGEQKWDKLPKGTEVKVKKLGDDWTRIAVLPAGSAAKANTAQLSEQCGVAAATPADKPAEAAPAEGKPAEAAPAEEKSAEEKPAEATASSEEKPAEAAPAEGEAAAAASPAAEASVDGEAAAEAPAEGEAPAEETAEPVEAVAEVPEASPAPDVAAAEDTKLPLVAVLDMRHAEGDEPLANALATVITSEIAARRDLRALSRNELQSVVAHQAEQALLGCESAKCASDVAKLVEADLVVGGGIERVEEAYVFSLTLFDPVAGTMRERVEATWRSDPDEIVLLVRPYVDRLFGGANAADYVGNLEVLAPEGASVFVDGKEIGAAPITAPIEKLPIGVHQIEVSQAGFVTARRDVVVSRGETTIARIELQEEPYYTQWWFWTAVGGGAAVAVAAGATIGTVAIIAAAEPPPTTVSVKSPLPATLD
jgi:hypothetical protein